MSKQPQPKSRTFAEVVREVEQQPLAPVRDYSGVVDPGGTRWHQHLAEISPARALELAKEGAPIAWDPCGAVGTAASTGTRRTMLLAWWLPGRRR